MIRIEMTASDQAMAKKYARNAEIGGRSNIRNHSDRTATLSMDQYVGQLGNIALAKYLGHGLLYRVSRWYADMNPASGDGGYDLPALAVDVKTSLMKGDANPMRYHLCVRPRELHEEWVYVHALCFETFEAVMLTGWALTRMLPPDVEKEGPLAGAYVIPVPSLLPMMPLRWTW